MRLLSKPFPNINIISDLIDAYDDGKIVFASFKQALPKYKYYKLLNRNNLKISYSCMHPSLNSNFLKDLTAQAGKKCSCQQIFSWWLAEKCWSEYLVYDAQVDKSDISQIKKHYGTAEKKTSKSDATIMQLLLKIKVKSKYRTLKI